MFNQEDILKLFLKRFDCAFKQTCINYIPVNSFEHWRLSHTSGLILKSKKIEIGSYLTPISLLLYGLKIRPMLFGEKDRKDFNGYLVRRYPLLILEEHMCLSKGVLNDYFAEGYLGSSGYNSSGGINGIAANLGCFISNKYFKTNIQHIYPRPWFK